MNDVELLPVRKRTLWLLFYEYGHALEILFGLRHNDKYLDRLCGSSDYGIFKPDTFEINDGMLKAYFSEGYRAYYKEPELLKKNDPKLYTFIEGLKDDKGRVSEAENGTGDVDSSGAEPGTTNKGTPGRF